MTAGMSAGEVETLSVLPAYVLDRLEALEGQQERPYALALNNPLTDETKMAVTKLMEGLYIIPGLVNIYILALPDALVLIDTGFARDTRKILDAIKSIGAQPSDIRHILLTHAHPDHIGGAAELQKQAGARIYAHAADVSIVETGLPIRRMQAAPGVRNRIVAWILGKIPGRVSTTHVDHLLEDGVAVPFDADLIAIHSPGHCAGQVAFLWSKNGGVLFVADACINRKGMVLAAVQEDVGQARRSLAKLAGLRFETACFGHGPPIMAGADQAFRKRWL